MGPIKLNRLIIQNNTRCPQTWSTSGNLGEYMRENI